MTHLVQDPSTADIDHRRFFELSPEMLATAGFDGCLKVVNPAFESVLGYSADELTGRPYVDFVHPDDVASTLLEAARLASGADSASFENRYRCEDGSYRWIDWSIRVDPDAEVLYCVASDVTERRREHDIIDQLVTELKRANADLGQFAYVASHDLSEPLRMVTSYMQLLADRYTGQLDADADEFIGYAVDGATRMKALIDDLLAYSKSGRVAPTHRSVDCADLLEGVLADLDGVIADAGAVVVVGDMPVLATDPGLLGQVFQNLLTNALKFVAPGVAPRIAVSAVRAGDDWQFSVKDNGIGIPEEHRERIFMMFKRLHARSEYPGTGIGLALCQKVVTRLEGRIWLDGDPAAGSTFHFTVPDARRGAPVGG